jgi:hypothetical protein
MDSSKAQTGLDNHLEVAPFISVAELSDVLIVEDNVVNSKVMFRHFMACGVEEKSIFCVCNGKDAIQLVRNYSVVFFFSYSIQGTLEYWEIPRDCYGCLPSGRRGWI